jgi:hypothetical protein
VRNDLVTSRYSAGNGHDRGSIRILQSVQAGVTLRALTA